MNEEYYVYAYNKSIEVSNNVLKTLLHTQYFCSFYEINSIPVSVAEDLFFKVVEGEVLSDKEIVGYAKWHTLALFTIDRKKKTVNFSYVPEIMIENCERTLKDFERKNVMKNRQITLNKIELVKKLTLQGKLNDEIMQITGFSRSTVCYFQKQAGVKGNGRKRTVISKEKKEIFLKMVEEKIKNGALKKDICAEFGISEKLLRSIKIRY